MEISVVGNRHAVNIADSVLKTGLIARLSLCPGSNHPNLMYAH